MQNNPLVTIGIPNFNYANYIKQALDSAANQTYQNVELIIVDDCSTDNSKEVINDWIREYKGTYSVKFIQNDNNQGLTKVCNLILKNANGKYFQTLDADDILIPEKIENQVEAFKKNKEAALVYSNMMLIDTNGKIIKDDYFDHIGYDESNMPEGDVFNELLKFNFIPYPLINSEMTRGVGGFDETLQVHDYSLWLKLCEKRTIIYCPGKTALYRFHELSMSGNFRTNPRSVEDVLTIKFRYYNKVDQSIKKIIKENIFFSAPYLYQYKTGRANYWLKQNFLLNPGIRSLGYFTAINLGIPFSFFEKIKSMIQRKKSNA